MDVHGPAYSHGRLGLAGALAAFGLLLGPTSALACKPEDPQGKHKFDVCEQSFPMPYPTGSGEKISSYAIEYIPKGATSVRYTLTFSPKPSNATLTQSFDPAAKGRNPDGSNAAPGPDEQAARVLFDWSALGPSTPAMGDVTYAVTFEEKAESLEVTLTHSPDKPRLGAKVVYRIHVYNPNDDPVDDGFVHFISRFGPFFDVGSVSGQEPALGDCHPSSEGGECNHLDLRAFQRATMEVQGTYKRNPGVVVADATTHAIHVPDNDHVFGRSFQELSVAAA